VRRPRVFIAVALVLVALALMLAACGGGDEGETTTSPAPAAAPSDGAAPPGVASQLPPGIAECLADQGVDLEGADINEIFHGDAVPPQVLNACFGALHQGGGVP
jgi:hypothetical protein